MNLQNAQSLLRANIDKSRAVLSQLDQLTEPLERAATLLLTALVNGRKVLCCGNGGSAADCAHLAAEIAGRYVLDRPGFAAVDLTANHSLMTALLNDFPPQEIFARQVEALGGEGDVLLAISTSGRSQNVKLALEKASAHGLETVAMLGKGGGNCAGLATVELMVPSDNTQRIQEAHLLLYHTLCDLMDPILADSR